jgi:subfamily B ATP-binding cassette protein MsbA
MVFSSPTFWRFMRYARPYWKIITGSILCGVLKFSLGLLLPASLGYIMDRVLIPVITSEENRANPEQLRQLYLGLGILIVVFVLRIPISYYRSYWAELAGNRTIFDVRNDLYHHIQKLSLSYHEKNRSGTTTSRIVNDVNTSQGILDRGVMSVLIDLIFLAGVIIFLLIYDMHLATVSLFTLPLYGLVFGILNPKLRVASRAVQAQMSELSGEVNEKIMGQQVVMAFVRERTERLSFFREHRKYFSKVMRRMQLHIMMFQFGDFFTFLGPIIVICYGSYRVIDGHLSPGDLLIFNGFLAFLYIPTRRLADASAALQTQLSGMDRVFDILDVEPDIQDKPGAGALTMEGGAIEFDDVHFSYDTGPQVLNGLSLKVAPGQSVAIVGRSGAGKSTLIQLVPRFYDITSGAIRIDGQNIQEVRQHSLRRHIGMVMQDAILFNGSIRENILYGKRNATEAEMLEAARMAHVDEFVVDMDHGYDTIIGERGITLSGGQKQRLSVARAFLRDPEILILDEATSSLDSHAEAIIQDAIDHLMQGRTTLVIAHRLSTIIDCDQVVVMEAGKVIQVGTHQELISTSGPYRALCEEQFGSVQLELLES